ncbi:YutD family protein [Apilactobacillus apisilvae]|uniref:YutD family protein n=1 Tax=Apilactobacillus apisilvae TaxID=2923364 RepID=A0ABY4PHE3_9LACO|nr:YutD family protein [Apilactobacillus apisilvae]UQS85219.1 YutD family protein [Apilactobacillus apisilvae]
MDRKTIEEKVEELRNKKRPLAKISQENEHKLLINGHDYEIITNIDNCFDLELFKQQYNPIFSRYNYIVGDYGYGILRLKGFFNDESSVNPQFQFSSIEDYIYEYANIGAKYFVIHNLEAHNNFNNKGNRTSFRKRKNRRHGFEEKITKQKRPINKRKNMKITKSDGKGKRHFIIKEGN